MLLACHFPPTRLLRHLNATELHSLAQALATWHRGIISGLDENGAKAHAGMVHTYGVAPGLDRKASVDATLKRLSCAAFWRDKINAIADFEREKHAALQGLLGSETLGLQPYCSDSSLEIVLARQFKNSTYDEKSIRRFLRKSANGSYLATLALATTAFERKYSSVFITLTLPGHYHSSAENYKGKNLAEGHELLAKVLSKLIARLSRKGICGEDFFGIRAAEINVSGCPHWHVILYCKPSLVTLIEHHLEKLLAAVSLDCHTNFVLNKDKVMQVRQATDFSLYKQAISYVFKNSYAGSNHNSISVLDALRQRVALSMYRKTQYQLIGSKGRKTAFNNLRKFAMKPEGLSGVAANLALKKGASERKEKQLAAVIAIFEGEAKRYEYVRQSRKNVYGEDVKSIISVKHKGSVDSETGDHASASGNTVRGIMPNASRYSEHQVSPHAEKINSAFYSKLNIRDPPSITASGGSVDCFDTWFSR